MPGYKKILVFTFSLFACLFFIVSSAPISQAQSKDQPSSFALEGLSATSIQLPESNFGPDKLFDNDPSTYWATMPGAAIDEGVLLRFAEPVYIHSIAFRSPTQKNLIPIAAIQFFINGQEMSTTGIYRPFPIQQKVKSLYIRITGLEGTSSTQALFSGQGQTGLSEIILYDRNNKVIPVLSPRIVKGRVKPSSALTPKEAYQSDYLFDSRLDFGWADGNPQKTGVGEFLEFETDTSVSISALKIWNGYQRSRTHFSANERVKEFVFSSQNTSASYTLKNSDSPQLVTLKKPLSGKNFKFSVSSVYPGSKYKDLVISELRLFDGQNWFILASGILEKDKQNLLQTAKQSLLASIIDRRFYQDKPHADDPDQVSVQSLILRSNGSFVLWKFTYNESSPSNNSEKIVADGNWQIKEASADKAIIRIFGRLHQLKKSESTNYNPYAGENAKTAKTETTQIFQDSLEISPTLLKSQKNLFMPFQYKTENLRK